MDFGLSLFPTDQTLQPVEVGRAAEEAGFESLFFPEHSHIPVSRESPWGGVTDAPPLPEWYWRSLDPFVALGAVAATTTRLKLGTGITLVAQRDPIWLAKEVATLDHLSGGRVIFGIGYGWNKEEMASHGVAYRQRRAILREKILMRSRCGPRTLPRIPAIANSGTVVGVAQARAETPPALIMGGAPVPGLSPIWSSFAMAGCRWHTGTTWTAT